MSAVCPLVLVLGVSLGREYNVGKLTFRTALFDLYICTVLICTFTLFKTNSCTYFKTHFHIHIY
jgi:hypothetical protein